MFIPFNIYTVAMLCFLVALLCVMLLRQRTEVLRVYRYYRPQLYIKGDRGTFATTWRIAILWRRWEFSFRR